MSQTALTSRALQALKGADFNKVKFHSLVSQMARADFQILILALGSQRQNDPRTFFRIIHSLLKLTKRSPIATGTTLDSGLPDFRPLSNQLRDILSTLYCPPNRPFSYSVVYSTANLDCPFDRIFFTPMILRKILT